MYKIIGADHKEYGPITADQIRQWISEGRINAVTRIQMEGEGGWRNASEFPEFAATLAHSPTPPPPQQPPLPPSMAPISMLPPTPPGKSNQLALWSMITGILSVLCCCGLIAPLPIVLGFVARSQINRDPRQTGMGFAVAGIALGILSLIMGIIWLMARAANPDGFQNLFSIFNQ